MLPSVRVSVLAGVALAWSVLSCAAEFRMWTSVDGKTVEAEFLRLDGSKVTLLRKEDNRRVEFDRKLLSRADQEWLDEHATDTGFGFGSKDEGRDRMLNPAKKVKIDKRAFVEHESPFEIPNLQFVALETPHFLILSNGRVKADMVGEHAERMWHDFNFFHPKFGDKWQNGKMAIFLTDNDEDYRWIGEWYAGLLAQEEATREAASEVAKTWMAGSAGVVYLSSDVAEKNSVMRRARVFRNAQEKRFEDLWSPFRTHCLAEDMLDLQMGYVSGYGADGLFWVSTGYAYFKEIDLCERSETVLAVYDDTAEDEVRTTQNADTRRAWADELRKMIRTKKVEPTIEALYKLNSRTVKASEVMLIYAMNDFLNSSNEMITKYADFVERIDTSKQIPVPIEMAKMFGFQSVEELETAWIDYMKSQRFK